MDSRQGNSLEWFVDCRRRPRSEEHCTHLLANERQADRGGQPGQRSARRGQVDGEPDGDDEDRGVGRPGPDVGPWRVGCPGGSAGPIGRASPQNGSSQTTSRASTRTCVTREGHASSASSTVRRYHGNECTYIRMTVYVVFSRSHDHMSPIRRAYSPPARRNGPFWIRWCWPSRRGERDRDAPSVAGALSSW